KQVETVRDINVALRLVVPDQQGGRSALVAADATQLVDGSYKLIATLPGGVSAAFSKRSDNVAVLSPSGSDSVLTFSGFSPPDANLEPDDIEFAVAVDGTHDTGILGSASGDHRAERAFSGPRPHRRLLLQPAAEWHPTAIRRGERVAALDARSIQQRELVRHEHRRYLRHRSAGRRRPGLLLGLRGVVRLRHRRAHR